MPRGQVVLDRVFSHTQEEQRRFEHLDGRAAEVFLGLAAARGDAYGAVHDDPDVARERSAEMLSFIESRRPQLGALQAIERVGTLAPLGRYPVPEETTAVSDGVLRFEGGLLVLHLLWDAEDRHVGSAIGPAADLPVVFFAPTAIDRFAGWAEGTEIQTPELVIARRDARICLNVDELAVCRTEP
jgi:hypothetical protein